MAQLKRVFWFEILKPLERRIGSLVSGGLIAYGVSVDHANSVGLGAAALLGVAVDLFASYQDRKRQAQK